MDTEELLQLKEKILSGEIIPKKAGEILFLNKTKSWHTKEWKEKRKILIKDSCEQCGSKEGLTLQHTWHPRNYSSIKYEICNKYGKLINEKYTIDSLITEDEVFTYLKNNIKQERRNICPKCGSVNISERKTISPKYRCNHCTTQFEEVANKLIPEFIDDRDININIKNAINIITYSDISWKIYKQKCKELLFKEYGEQIEKETIITLIDEYLRYISLEDTVTFCKKCAFLWDKKGMNLCPVCKVKYKKIYNDKCFECIKKSD